MVHKVPWEDEGGMWGEEVCPTCPMKSMKPSPDLGTPCSGQSVKWNWRMVRDWPSLASVTWGSHV